MFPICCYNIYSGRLPFSSGADRNSCRLLRRLPRKFLWLFRCKLVVAETSRFLNRYCLATKMCISSTQAELNCS